jgi:hypothetical protein
MSGDRNVRIHHLLVTRFNLRPWKGNRPDQYLDPSWLESRLHVFEAVTAPCVRAQTADDVYWFMLIDPDTPRQVVSRLRAAHPRLRTVDVVGEYGTTASRPQLVVRELAATAARQHAPDVLLQSRIDTDDGIAPDYFERLRTAVRPGRTEYLNFPLGYQLDLSRGYAYQYRWPSGSLVNLAQPPSMHPIGIHDARHKQVRRVAPLRELGQARTWLQVIHGLNLTGQLHGGRPVAPARIVERFPIDPTLLQPRPVNTAVADAARWVGRGARLRVSREALVRSLPARAARSTRWRHRAERLRPVLEELRGLPATAFTAARLEGLLAAWGEGGRLPAAGFLEEVAHAASEARVICELGVGPTTLLLHLVAGERVVSYDSIPERREQLRFLLDATGLAGRPEGRIRADLASAPLSAELDLLIVNSAPDGGADDGYEVLPRALGGTTPGTTLLCDDARRATSLDGTPRSLPDFAITFAAPKAFARTVIG